MRFRCSSIGKLMTEPRSKSEGPLSTGAKTYIRELAAQEIFGVDFVEEGEIEAIYVGSNDVTEIVRDCTRWALESVVKNNAARWFEDYRQELAQREREERKAA